MMRLLLLLLWVGGVQAVELELPLPSGKPDADEIARQVYFVNHFYALEELEVGGSGKPKMAIINQDTGGKVSEVRASRYIKHRLSDTNIRTKDMVMFQTGALRGTGILVTDFSNPSTPMSFSAWLPALRKVRRMGEPPYDDKWGGSILTYGDIYLRRPEDERHELIGEGSLAGCLESLPKIKDLENVPEQDCSHSGADVYLLKSSPTRADDWWYDYRQSWVDKKTFADYKTLYYKDGKEIQYMAKSWRSLGLGDPRAQIWQYWFARDGEGKHQGIAVMPIEAVGVNSGRDEGFWSESTLGKIHQ